MGRGMSSPSRESDRHMKELHNRFQELDMNIRVLDMNIPTLGWDRHMKELDRCNLTLEYSMDCSRMNLVSGKSSLAWHRLCPESGSNSSV